MKVPELRILLAQEARTPFPIFTRDYDLNRGLLRRNVLIAGTLPGSPYTPQYRYPTIALLRVLQQYHQRPLVS